MLIIKPAYQILGGSSVCFSREHFCAKPLSLLRTSLLSLAGLAYWLPVSAPAAVVLDQIGGLTSADSFDFSSLPGPSPSQFFSDFPDSNVTVLENFTVTSTQLTITSVSVVFRALGGFQDFSNLEGYAVNVFSAPTVASNTLAGDVTGSLVPAGSSATVVSPIIDTSGQHEYGLVSLAAAFTLPSAGEYWFGVSAVGDHTTIGQFMVSASPIPPGTPADARLANPGEGFGVGPLSFTGNHHAYSLTAVPEPAGTTLCVLAASWWLRQRKRLPAKNR